LEKGEGKGPTTVRSGENLCEENLENGEKKYKKRKLFLQQRVEQDLEKHSPRYWALRGNYGVKKENRRDALAPLESWGKRKKLARGGKKV